MKFFLRLGLFALSSLFLLSGCDNEDDVNAIFSNTTWRVVYTAYTTDWDKNNAYDILFTYDEETQTNPDSYRVVFGSEKVVIYGATATWQGKYSVEGKDRYFQITDLQKAGNGQTSKEQEFLNRVANARYYKGDTNILQLFQSDKKNYIQLRSIN